ncbi:universal stress protein [Cecembia sp.]|uniref:universal stress protein n=1 Tax=Cecembia sp. TaxID=1898110 RepID=UPI0025B8F4E3|nr:universal stress protein [Cecembia sp.]
MEQLLKIYVMVDFSDYTESTLKMVKTWVAGKKAEIKVLHQLDFHLPTLANHDLRLKLLYDHKRKLLNQWLKLNKEIFGSSDAVSLEILEEPILEYLKKIDEDAMIFMGLKGGGILKQIFLGSMVSEVIERLNHITVAVPKTFKKEDAFDKLVVTAHPKFGFNEEVFGRLMTCLPTSVRSIHWVSIAREGDDEDTLYDYLRMLSIMHTLDLKNEISVFIGADVFSKVKSFFNENGNQMLLIQKGGRTFQDKIFRKFLVNELVFDGSIPLIVLPLK